MAWLEEDEEGEDGEDGERGSRIMIAMTANQH